MAFRQTSRQRVDGPHYERPLVYYVGGEDIGLRIDMLLRLREAGFDVAAAGSGDGAEFCKVNIPFDHYPLRRHLGPLSDIKSIARLGQLFRKRRPLVVHAFDTKPSILAPLAAARVEVPNIIRTITGAGYVFSSEEMLARLIRPVLRVLHARADKACHMTIFYNRGDRDLFLTRGMASRQKAILVPGSGVDVEKLEMRKLKGERWRRLRRRFARDDELIVLMVSRLTKQKGVFEYLAAARQLHGRAKARFILVGPVQSEGRQAVPRSMLEEHGHVVTWLGKRNDVPELLSLADIFVLPTYYGEGIPRAILEAGALGVPVIATDIGACREVITHRANGLLVPPRNVPELCSAIALLCSDEDLRYKLGTALAKTVKERFSLDRVADIHTTIYNTLLGRPSEHPMLFAGSIPSANTSPQRRK